MASTLPPQGLIGFLFQGTPEDQVPACDDICTMASELRTRIMRALLDMEINPDKSVEVDGEVWAPDRLYSALTRLYDWTFRACQKEEPTAIAFITHGRTCGS